MAASRSRVLVAPTLAALLAMGALPASAQDAETRVAVTLTESGCEPSALTVPAGPVVFEITNMGGDIGELEILQGDFVIDEVENIVPTFQNNMVTRLDGGEYVLVCFTLQSPRGTLTVTGGPAGTRPPSAVVDAATLAAYQAEYETYVRAQGSMFAEAVAGFVAAIKAGDLETAKALYAPSRIGWESIEPIAELFSDLDQAVDFREEDFAAGVDDPAFTGYHRIERILWVEDASGDLDALADKLLADANDLSGRLSTLPIDPYTMAQGAGALIDEVAQTKMTGEEDRYSETDLWSIAANIDGSKRIVDIFRPSLAAADPAYLERLDGAFAAIDALTAKYRDGDGFQPFSAITPGDLTAMQAALAGLSEVLGQLAGTLGLRA
ncbi:MAG: iron uptake system protein EfeO [Chloroflexi bacterium]|nr:iron uptake system protein EfeO [Chloroflexota bacterium]